MRKIGAANFNKSAGEALILFAFAFAFVQVIFREPNLIAYDARCIKAYTKKSWKEEDTVGLNTEWIEFKRIILVQELPKPMTGSVECEFRLFCHYDVLRSNASLRTFNASKGTVFFAAHISVWAAFSEKLLALSSIRSLLGERFIVWIKFIVKNGARC